MFTYGHGVVHIAVIEHALGDGGRGMFLVCEYTHFSGSLDERTVKLFPRAACEGDDAHVVVGEEETVGEELEGVE